MLAAKRARLAGLQRATRRMRKLVIATLIVEIALVISLVAGWLG